MAFCIYFFIGPELKNLQAKPIIAFSFICSWMYALDLVLNVN